MQTTTFDQSAGYYLGPSIGGSCGNGAEMASFVARLMSLSPQEIQCLHSDSQLMRQLTETQLLVENRLEQVGKTPSPNNNQQSPYISAAVDVASLASNSPSSASGGTGAAPTTTQQIIYHSSPQLNAAAYYDHYIAALPVALIQSQNQQQQQQQQQQHQQPQQQQQYLIIPQHHQFHPNQNLALDLSRPNQGFEQQQHLQIHQQSNCSVNSSRQISSRKTKLTESKKFNNKIISEQQQQQQHFGLEDEQGQNINNNNNIKNDDVDVDVDNDNTKRWKRKRNNKLEPAVKCSRLSSSNATTSSNNNQCSSVQRNKKEQTQNHQQQQQQTSSNLNISEQQQPKSQQTHQIRRYKGEFDEPDEIEVERRQIALTEQNENYHQNKWLSGQCACVLGSKFEGSKTAMDILRQVETWRQMSISDRLNFKWSFEDLPKDIPLADIKRFEDLRREASNGRADFGGASKRKPLGIRGTRQFLLILYCLWGHPGRQDPMQRDGYCPHCFAKIRKANDQSTLVRVVNHFNMKHRKGANPRLSPKTSSTSTVATATATAKSTN